MQKIKKGDNLVAVRQKKIQSLYWTFMGKYYALQ